MGDLVLKRWLVAILVAFTSVYAAEKLPVQIHADKLNYSHNLISAVGNASIRYNDYQINAEKIEIDTERNLISGEGNVQIERAGEPFLPARSFSLSINDEQLTLSGSKSTVNSAFAAEPFFIDLGSSSFKQAPGNDANLGWGQRATLTTCDLDAPHYWVAAKYFIYYPGEKIVAYHMTMHFWASPIPVFYTPYYEFALGERRVVFTFPKIGSNIVEGNFIKTETRYFADKYHEGSVYVDAMQYKGNGKGWRHSYNLAHPGEIYLYQVYEQDAKRDSTIVRWQQKLNLDAYTTLGLNHNYRNTYLLPSGYSDQMEDVLNYNYRDGNQYQQANYRFFEDYTNEQERQSLDNKFTLGQHSQSLSWRKDYHELNAYRRESLNLNHTVDLTPQWQYRINPNYNRYKFNDDPFEERLDLAMELQLTPEEQKYYRRMTIRANWYYDLDGDLVTKDYRDEFIEKAPEITVEAVPLHIFGETESEALFTVDSTYQTAQIREAKYFTAFDYRRVFQAQKYNVEFTPRKTYKLGLADVTLLRSYKQSGYDTGDAHYLISDKPNLRSDWWGFLRNELTYEDTRGDGASPFFFDDPAVTTVKRGTHTLTLYHQQAIAASVYQSKDFNYNLYGDYLYKLNIDPWQNRKVQFDFSSGKNYYTNIYRDLVSAVQINPIAKHNYRLSFTKDINDNHRENPYAGKIKSASSEMDFAIGKPYAEMDHWNFWKSEWRFIVKNIYDYSTEYFNLQSFALGKDLHCWYMRYNYTPVRKEWSIVFTLKAFPNEPITMQSNEDDEFSFDAFSDTLNSKEVKRYE